MCRAAAGASTSADAIVERCCCVDAAAGSLNGVVLDIHDDRTVPLLNNVDSVAGVVRDVCRQRVTGNLSDETSHACYGHVDAHALADGGSIVGYAKGAGACGRGKIDCRLAGAAAGGAGKSASRNCCVVTRRGTAHVNLDAVRSVSSDVLTVNF